MADNNGLVPTESNTPLTTIIRSEGAGKA